MENRLTLFVATDADLDACFPGWRPPLAEPRLDERVNPFTGEPLAFRTWDPGRSPAAGAPGSIRGARRRKPVVPILPPEGDSARWLEEEDTPALLRTFPHFALWAVSVRPLSELLGVLDLPSPAPEGRFAPGTEWTPAPRFVDCPAEEGTIEALPDAAIAPLAALDDRGAKACLAAWQKALGLRGKAIQRIESEFAEGSAWALRRLRALAAEAERRGAHLFVASRTEYDGS